MIIEIKVIDCPCCKSKDIEVLASFGSDDSLVCVECGCAWFQSRRRGAGESEA